MFLNFAEPPTGRNFASERYSYISNTIARVSNVTHSVIIVGRRTSYGNSAKLVHLGTSQLNATSHTKNMKRGEEESMKEGKGGRKKLQIK
jgi:hypothetical protein